MGLQRYLESLDKRMRLLEVDYNKLRGTQQQIIVMLKMILDKKHGKKTILLRDIEKFMGETIKKYDERDEPSPQIDLIGDLIKRL